MPLALRPLEKSVGSVVVGTVVAMAVVSVGSLASWLVVQLVGRRKGSNMLYMYNVLMS